MNLNLVETLINTNFVRISIYEFKLKQAAARRK